MPEITYKTGIENMDFERVTEMLSCSYWVPGIGLDEVRKGALNSALVVGAFTDAGLQIGFARTISDKTRFGYIMDVYVVEDYRRQGIGQALVREILDHTSLRDVYQWVLITQDAHGVYQKLGFKPLGHPEGWLEIRNDRPSR